MSAIAILAALYLLEHIQNNRFISAMVAEKKLSTGCTRLTVRIHIPLLLSNHPEMTALHKRLLPLNDKERTKVAQLLERKPEHIPDNAESWAKKLSKSFSLLEEYRGIPIKKEGDIWIIDFLFKDNNLYLNDELQPLDVPYHEIFLNHGGNRESDDDSILIRTIANGISLRLFIVNGVIRLQVGEYREDFSPKKQGLHYQAWSNLHSFPLMYFPELGIPSKFLNVTAYPVKQSDLGNDADDYREAADTIKKYDWLRYSESLEIKGIGKLWKEFGKKAEQSLTHDGFLDEHQEEEEEEDYYWQKAQQGMRTFRHKEKWVSLYFSNYEARKDLLNECLSEYTEKVI